jgi:Na+/H+-dicarboxylate symporter
MSDRQTDTSRPSSTSYASSIVALVLGTVLAALRRGRQIWPRLLIASIFGFAVLLPPEDRDAALALLDETAAARRA